jgi:hypothetical protein
MCLHWVTTLPANNLRGKSNLQPLHSAAKVGVANK